MTAATLVADYEVALWNLHAVGPFTSITPDVNAGDLLVVLAGSGEWGNAGDDILAPSGGSVSYTTGPKTKGTANNGMAFSWYGVAPSTTGALPLSIQTNGTSPFWGYSAVRFSGSDGVGAVTADNRYGTGAPSLALTTLYAESGILAFFADWNVSAIGTIVWRTNGGFTPATDLAGGQVIAARENFHGTYLAAFWPNLPIGAYTLGLTTPSGTKWAGLAMEIRGSSGVAGPPVGSQFMPFFQH